MSAPFATRTAAARSRPADRPIRRRPGQRDHRCDRRHRRPRHGLARRAGAAGGSRDRAHRSDGGAPGPVETLHAEPGSRRYGRPERRRRAHRLAPDRRLGLRSRRRSTSPPLTPWAACTTARSRVAVEVEPRVGTEDFVIPVVGECDDSWLSEGRVVQVEAEDAARAVASAAGGVVAEGAVGAGTGMMTKGYKAGIGTASRIAPSIGGAVGVLVLSNFYPPPLLVMDGVPVGELLGEPPETKRSKAGSCIAVVAVDAPLSAHQLERVARRAGLGLARCGSVAHHGSGEIFVAFAPPGRRPRGEAPVATVPGRRPERRLRGGRRRDRGGRPQRTLGGAGGRRARGPGRPGSPA